MSVRLTTGGRRGGSAGDGDIEGFVVALEMAPKCIQLNV